MTNKMGFGHIQPKHDTSQAIKRERKREGVSLCCDATECGEDKDDDGLARNTNHKDNRDHDDNNDKHNG